MKVENGAVCDRFFRPSGYIPDKGIERVKNFNRATDTHAPDTSVGAHFVG